MLQQKNEWDFWPPPPLCLSSQNLQQQAFLVLQENQILVDQLETQNTGHQAEGNI